MFGLTSNKDLKTSKNTTNDTELRILQRRFLTKHSSEKRLSVHPTRSLLLVQTNLEESTST